MTKFQAVILMAILSTHEASEILLIPGPATSHCLEMMSIGQELLHRGHHVTLLAMLFDPKHCTSGIDRRLYGNRFRIMSPKIHSSFQQKQDDIMHKAGTLCFENINPFEIINLLVSPMVRNNCDAAFNDTSFLKELEKAKFDISLAEGVPFTGCFIAIPLLLDIPVVAVGSYMDPQEARTPLQTNVFPSILTEYTNIMTFPQRLVNTLISLLNPILKIMINPAIDLAKYDQRLAKYDSRDLVKEAVLFLEDSDYIFDYPKALFPNFIQVGGLTAHPASPLPKDLEEFMNDSDGGVILVTFGSILKEMPIHLKNKLVDAFHQVDRPILYKNDNEEDVKNIRYMKWIPQNNVLGHSKTKLFISHCGKNGFWESLYHGVPIICMAVHAETYSTKVKVRKSGIGSSFDIFSDSSDRIAKTINNVLNNDTIHKNMQKMSTLFRDRAETPGGRAASAIEHVLKYGGEHMRPPSVDMNFIEYSCLDVYSALFFCLVVIVILCIWIIRRCCARDQKTKSKTD